MKTVLKLSILLNLLLAGGLIFIFLDQRREHISSPPVSADARPTAQAPTRPAVPVATETTAAFSWQQLDAQDDYRLFVANLRAIGCPENTIGDIVQGNVSRAFAWERARLKMGDSGSGPWSKANEAQLVSSLLGKESRNGTMVPSQGASSQAVQGGGQSIPTTQGTGNLTWPSGSGEVAENSSQPQGAQMAPQSFFQNGNAGAVQRGAFSQTQQPLDGANNGNPNAQAYQNDGPANSAPNNLPAPDPSSTSTTPAPPNPLGPNDPYALSAQDMMAIDQQQYYDWFQPQVADNPSGENLNVSPTSAQ